MNTKILIFSALLIGLYGCKPSEPETKEIKNQVTEELKKAIPADGQTFSRKNLSDSSSFFRINIDKNKHVQHNPNYSNGSKGYKNLMKTKYNSQKFDVYRLTEYNDYVFAHSILKDSVDLFTCMDIFEFSEGKIIGHFFGRELIAQNPETTNNVTISGPTSSMNDNADNIRLKVAANFIRFSRIEGDQNKNRNMVDVDNFTEHNQYIFKSKNPLLNYYYDLKSAGFDQEYDQLISAVGGGNYAITVSKGIRNENPVQIFDLFRFEDTRIVEHWDVVQEYQ